MTLLRRLNGLYYKFDDDSYPVFTSPFYVHPDFIKTAVDQGDYAEQRKSNAEISVQDQGVKSPDSFLEGDYDEKK